MPYPPPPWTLKGHGVQTIHLVDSRAVRDLVPPELEIVSVLPGKTLGVIGFAHYGPGSDLEYNELIIAPAYVKHGGKRGFWVSHIYVDNADSLAGGREIWGVPKELAEFRWEEGASPNVAAKMEGRKLCRLAVGRRLWLFRKELAFPTYSRLKDDLLRFIGLAEARLGLTKGKVEVPPESPFSWVPFGKPLLTLWLKEMTLVCEAPKVVQKLSIAAGAGV